MINSCFLSVNYLKSSRETGSAGILLHRQHSDIHCKNSNESCPEGRRSRNDRISGWTSRCRAERWRICQAETGEKKHLRWVMKEVASSFFLQNFFLGLVRKMRLTWMIAPIMIRPERRWGRKSCCIQCQESPEWWERMICASGKSLRSLQVKEFC